MLPDDAGNLDLRIGAGIMNSTGGRCMVGGRVPSDQAMEKGPLVRYTGKNLALLSFLQRVRSGSNRDPNCQTCG